MSDETANAGTEPPGAPARRQFLRGTAAGAAGLAAWSITGGTRTASAATIVGQARGATQAQGPSASIAGFGTGWLFGPATAGSDQPGFDDSGLKPVTLPHTVAALSWQNWDPASWEQVWVYRKHFDAPASASKMRVFVDFAAAMTQSSLTLNGHALPGRTGGYLPFSAEVTDLLTSRGNVLAVTLDSGFNINVPPDQPAPNAPTATDFWQPGGIYREVRLRSVPQVFLVDVFAKPVNVLNPAKRQVDVQVTVDAAVVPEGSAQIALELRDGPRTVAATTVPVTISAMGQTTVTGTLSGLSGITLWDIDNPKLYTVLATLRLSGAPVHDYQVRTGFREASFQLDGFYLNGRRVQLFGVNRHQFYPFAGGAMSARVQRKDAEILRNDLNCTMVRCSHYPQSEDFFDACDELGLMVWEEIPGWNYMGDADWQAAAYRDVGDMIVRDRNHPSIIVWGAMPNESRENVPLYTATNALAKSLDDSRATGGDDFDRTDTSYEFDVFSFHDYSSQTGPDGQTEPNLQPPTDAAGKPFLVCEAVGALSGPGKYYRRTDTQQIQQGQATAHARVHDITYSDSRYLGLLAWSGYDYPSGTGNQYHGVKYTGVVDLFRNPKPGAAIYQSQVDPKVKPVIQPAFYWDFGSASPVTGLSKAMICSNLDRLEVYVDGAHFATVTPDTTDYGHLPYPPSFVDFSSVNGSALPELRIEGYLGSARVASRSFAGNPAGDRLSLAVDDTQLVADGMDETRVVFRAVDKYGAPRPYVGGQLQLSVTGPATLVGDNPFDFAAAGASGAVWVRTLPGKAGSVTVRAAHPSIGSATVAVTAAPAATAAPSAQDYATSFAQVPPAP